MQGNKLPRLLVILCGSFIFYGWWDWRFLLLIVFSITSNYYFSQVIRSSPDKKLVALSIILNLVILGFFKYFNFFIESFSEVVSIIFGQINVVTLNIILPVGISFFTFQAISYIIDTHKGEIKHNPTLLEFAVYLSLFPQLVAGPIVRAAHLIPQIQNKIMITHQDIYRGFSFILWGFFLKLGLAENAAPIVDIVFSEYALLSRADILLGVFSFSLQIYGDFAGYSLIAIGLGVLLGFDFGINFRRPYFSSSFSDFWRRWHISLSSWLRDYLYIPLGGNRHGNYKTYRNLFITMVLGGLWHGASWNFVIWGALHGTYLSIEKLLGLNTQNNRSNHYLVNAIQKGLYGFTVFFFVSFAWVFFRAKDTETAIGILEKLLYSESHFFLKSEITQLITLVFICILVVIKDSYDEYTASHTSANSISTTSKGILAIFCFFVLLVFAKFNDTAFIYFQF